MAAPNPPDIYIRPLCSNTTLTYYWTAPTSGTPPTSYNLTVSGPGGGTCNVLSPGYYTVTGLTNGSNYSSYIQSSNANGLSASISFRDVQPGIIPNNPVSPYATATRSTVQLFWGAPPSAPVAPIKWYVVTDTLCNVRYNTEGFVTQLRIGSVSPGTRYFAIQAVNDPGYSTPINAGPVTIDNPVIFNWSTFKYTVVTPTEVRSSNNIDWDAYATSDVGLSSNFSISTQPRQTTIQSMFGLSSAQTPSFPVYNYMPHCLYTAANGSLYLFDNGSFGPSLGTYKQNDVISMTLIGSNMTYKKNGASIYTKVVNPLTTVYLCCTAGSTNATYSNVQFIYL